MEKAELAGLEPPDLEPLESDQMPRRGLAHQADGTPTPKTQRNFTDPESHIMKGNGEMVQGYNCQAVVDGDHQVIVAVGVSNQAPDVEHLEPMLERTIANTGAIPKTFIADAGYWSEDNAELCTEAKTNPHIAAGRQKHGQPPPCTKGRIPKDLGPKERMARTLRTIKGREIYAKRKTIPEPVFGQTKEGRGLRRFLMRGLEKVNGRCGARPTTSSSYSASKGNRPQEQWEGCRAHQRESPRRSAVDDADQVAVLRLDLWLRSRFGTGDRLLEGLTDKLHHHPSKLPQFPAHLEWIP